MISLFAFLALLVLALIFQPKKKIYGRDYKGRFTCLKKARAFYGINDLRGDA